MEDEFAVSIQASKDFEVYLKKLTIKFKEDKALDTWMEIKTPLLENLMKFGESHDISTARNHFIALSEQVIQLAKQFKPKDQTFYVQSCPMANENKGATWLSSEDKVLNPYFGASMLTCGAVEEKL